MKSQIISYFLLFLLVSSLAQLFSQDEKNQSTKTEYSIQEGIYTNFEEFKNNNPPKKYMPVVLSPTEVTEYLAGHPSKVIISSSGQFIWVGHFKENGEFVRMQPDSVWGFVKDDEIVVKYKEYLVKLDEIGALCHFNLKDVLFANELNVKNDNQYFFEFETGKIKRFKLGDFLSVLQKNDMELYQRILKLDSYKKMRASMFDFLLEYNLRHPIRMYE